MAQQERRLHRYWAFISYSHHDKRVARRLVHELRHQRVPTAWRAEVESDAGTFVAFLDEQESGANADLSAELRMALDASRKLIVICSPFAVASRYVTTEIRYFHSRGRSSDIICLIASGVPNATEDGHPEIECFPEPLRCAQDALGANVMVPLTERPLAAALGDETDAEWASAVEQIAAGVLGISRGELKQLRARRKLGMIAIASVGALVFCAAMGTYLWAFYWPTSTYSRDFARRFGAWEEIDSLSRAQARSRAHSFEFVRRGTYGKLISVRAVNGHGQCAYTTYITSITGDDFAAACSRVRACSVDFEYDNAGEIDRELIRDQFGNAIETLTYNSPTIGILSEAVIGCSRTRTGIEFVEFERFEHGPWKGLNRTIRFRGGPDKGPRANQQYAFGNTYEYDGNSRIYKTYALDEFGKAKITKSGNAGSRYGFDAAGKLVDEEFLDVDGHLIRNVDGVARYEHSMTPAGTAVRAAFGPMGEPVYDKDGVHAVETRYSADGDLISITYRDIGLERTLPKGRAAERRFEVDAKGFVTGEQFFDEKLHPTRGGREGCYRLAYSIDANGTPISTRCYDAQGRPDYSYFGVHETRQGFDDRGNSTDESYWGVTGQPLFCVHTNDEAAAEASLPCPMHRVVSTYDPTTNNRVRVRFFDPDGNLSMSGESIAGWNSRFDGNGFEVQHTSVGRANTPWRDNTHSFGQHLAPDRFYRDAESTQVGADGNPAPLPGGELTAQVEYDSLGRKVRTQFRDASGEVMPYVDSGQAIRTEFDVFGNSVAKYFHVDPNSLPGIESVATFRWKFDRYQRETEFSSFNTGGQLAPFDEQAAIRITTRDARGNATGVRYLDADRAPALITDGTAGFDASFDSRDRQIERINVGLSGEPLADKQGVCRYARNYDERGHLIEERYMDCHGNPTIEASAGVFMTRFQYDERGNELRRTYLDAAGRAMLAAAGSAGTIWQYNANNKITAEMPFGVDGKLLGDAEGTAIKRYSYDEIGNMTEMALHTADDKLIRIVASSYDSRGREIGRRMLTAARQRMLAPQSGRAEVRFYYDERGHLIEERSYGLKGEPVNRIDVGWHRRRSIYKFGVLQERRCSTTGGVRVAQCADD